MAYEDQANLANDGEFQRRLLACITQEAVVRPPEDALGQEVLTNSTEALSWFMPLISSVQELINFYSDPNGGGQSNVPDEAILAAVQANWQRVADLHPVT
jgi:hypothetical protein